MITRIENQAIKLYTPSETRFNERTSACQWHADYFPLVTCDDVSEIIVDGDVAEENIDVDGDFDFVVSGANTHVVPNKLRDTGANFIAAGIQVGMTVNKEIGGAFIGRAKVTNIDSATVLSLDSDIFNFTNTDYEISWWEYEGEVTLANNDFTVNNVTAIGSWLQQDVLTIGKYYKVTFDITSVSSDVLGDQIRVLIGGNLALVLDETDIVANTYVVYGLASSTTFRIETDGGMVVSIDNIKIDMLDDIMFYVVNCDDDFVEYTNIASDLEISITSGQFKLSIDWSNLASGYICQGCYYIGVLSGDDLSNLDDDRINDGDFLGAGWNLGTDWLHTGTKAALNSAGGAGDLTQTALAFDFLQGLSYDVSFDISGYVSGSVTVKLFNGTTEVVNLGTFNTNGTHTVSTGVLSANCDIIKFVPNTGVAQYNIDNVSAIFDLSDTDWTFRTDCFELAESHECTVKLSGANLDNAFAIDFIGLQYNPVIRVQGELRVPEYDDESEIEEDSLGENVMIYYNSDKIQTLHLYDLPEWLHDFIRLLKGYDIFLIDDNQYFPTSQGYTPEWLIESNKVFDLAKVNFTVKQKTELNKNKFC